jgi:hypothetical protein
MNDPTFDDELPGRIREALRDAGVHDWSQLERFVALGEALHARLSPDDWDKLRGRMRGRPVSRRLKCPKCGTLLS